MELRDGDPERVGGYVLLKRLGAGGMGTVYLAHSESGREVAVKVVHRQYAEDTEFRVRFRHEVTAARRVSGAFTAPVVDADPEADIPWMATAYVPGRTLRARVREDGPLTGPELHRLAVGLVEALADLHRVQVIHRDLKPDNVLLTEDGPRVIDFGISRAADQQTLTATGEILGTPRYMSPEQFDEKREVTAASDVFSLGSVLVFAATGRGPFDTEEAWMAGYRVVEEPPELGGLYGAVREIAEWCLEKEPADRPSPPELLEAFRRVPATGWGPCPEGAEPARPARGVARRRLALGGALAVALAVTVWGTTALTDFSSGAGTPSGKGADHVLVEPTATARPKGWAAWERKVPRAQIDTCIAAQSALLCTSRQWPGDLVAYATSTGKHLWTREYWHPPRPTGLILPFDVVGTSEDGTLAYYIAPAEQSKRSVTAVDARTGDVRWTTPEGSAAKDAVVSQGIVVTLGVDEEIISWDPRSGDMLWHDPTHRRCGLTAGGGHVFSPPCNGAGRAEFDARTGPLHRSAKFADMKASGRETALVLPRPDSATLHVLDLSSKELTKTELPVAATYAEADGAFYGVTASGTVIAADAKTGAVRWRRKTKVETDRSRPVVEDGRVYFATTDARIICLSAADGHELWRSAARRDPAVGLRSDATALIAVRDGRVWALSQRGTLFELRRPN